MPLDAHRIALRRPSPVFIPAGTSGCTRIMATGIVGGIMFLLASAVPVPAAAQSMPAEKGACEQPPHTAATAPKAGPDSGTKPGNEGSTGWTGGTGGSYTGLTPHASTPASPDRQPEVVTGVNPKPDAPSRAC